VSQTYDAILVVGFGGPESRDDVMPFLRNVTRGRNIPEERLLEVAEHYYHFGGVSPINAQVRELIAALRPELESRGINVPIYWGNRNWHPLLPDTVQQMTTDGVKRALAVFHAAYSSYSSCRQYQENVEAARQTVGENAPQIDKVRAYFNQPGFISANVARLKEAIAELPADQRDQVQVAFTAHSIPLRMSDSCDYAAQLSEVGRLVAEAVGIPESRWKLVYQSRSGRPQDPWLEPDICDHLEALKAAGHSAVAIAPIGFLSDHIEVLFDLDDEARHKADEIGLTLVRAKTVGTHPDFVAALGDLIVARFNGPPALACGLLPARPDTCPANCCPSGMPTGGRPMPAS
jgi:ferrochelatase